MGFGLLLIGYMFAFLATAGLGTYIFAGVALGSIFMFFGLKELRKYSPVFVYALIGSVLLFICSILGGVAWGIGTFTENNTEVLSTVFSISRIAISLLFEIAMLYGIADLSKRVDYPDTREKAFTNMICVGVYNVFQIITMLPIITTLSGVYQSAVMMLLVFAQVLYTAINTFLIFKCYAMICPVGQESMPRKKSRFAFINKFREIRDAKDNKAIEEMKNYYEDKLKSRNSKKKSKKKKKK